MSEDSTNTEDTNETTEQPPAIDPSAFASLQESVAKLEAKNRELLEEKAKVKKEAEQAAVEAAKKSGDIEALENSWREKLESSQTELKGQLTQYQSMVAEITSGSEARKLASDLALPGHTELLLPHIQSRLTTEIREGRPQVRVLDAGGNPSALSVEDLRKEIATNPLFAPILAGSRASGGGQTGGSNGGSARKPFDQMSDSEKVELRKADPQEYKRVVDTFYGRA